MQHYPSSDADQFQREAAAAGIASNTDIRAASSMSRQSSSSFSSRSATPVSLSYTTTNTTTGLSSASSSATTPTTMTMMRQPPQLPGGNRNNNNNGNNNNNVMMMQQQQQQQHYPYQQQQQHHHQQQQPMLSSGNGSVSSGNTIRTTTSTQGEESAFSDVTMTAANSAPLMRNPWFQQFSGGAGSGRNSNNHSANSGSGLMPMQYPQQQQPQQQQQQQQQFYNNNNNNNQHQPQQNANVFSSFPAGPGTPVTSTHQQQHALQFLSQGGGGGGGGGKLHSAAWASASSTSLPSARALHQTPSGFYATTTTTTSAAPQSGPSSNTPAANPFATGAKWNTGGNSNNNNNNHQQQHQPQSAATPDISLHVAQQQELLKYSSAKFFAAQAGAVNKNPGNVNKKNNNNSSSLPALVTVERERFQLTRLEAAPPSSSSPVSDHRYHSLSAAASAINARSWRLPPRARDFSGGRSAMFGSAPLVDPPALAGALKCNAPSMACHSCSVIGEFLLVIGGAMGSQQIADTFAQHLPSQQWYKLGFVGGAAPRSRVSPTSCVVKVSRTAEYAKRLIPQQEPMEVVAVFGGCLKKAASDSSLRVVTVSWLHTRGVICWGGAREDGGASSSVAAAVAEASIGAATAASGTNSNNSSNNNNNNASSAVVPKHRRGHCAFNRGEETMIIIMGRADDGTLLNDVWELKIEFGASSSPIAAAMSVVEQQQQQSQQTKRGSSAAPAPRSTVHADPFTLAAAMTTTNESGKSAAAEEDDGEAIEDAALSAALLAGTDRPGVAFVATWREIVVASNDNECNNNTNGAIATTTAAAARSLPTPRHGHGCVYVPATDRAYIFGGEVTSNAPNIDDSFYRCINDMWQLDFATRTWREITFAAGAPMPPPRYAFISWSERVQRNAAPSPPQLQHGNQEEQKDQHEQQSLQNNNDKKAKKKKQLSHRLYFHGGDDHVNYYSDVWRVEIPDDFGDEQVVSATGEEEEEVRQANGGGGCGGGRAVRVPLHMPVLEWEPVVRNGDGPSGRSGHASFLAPRCFFTDGGLGLHLDAATIELARQKAEALTTAAQHGKVHEYYSTGSNNKSKNNNKKEDNMSTAFDKSSGNNQDSDEESGSPRTGESQQGLLKRLLQEQERRLAGSVPFMHGGEMVVSDSELAFGTQCFAWSTSPLFMERGHATASVPKAVTGAAAGAVAAVAADAKHSSSSSAATTTTASTIRNAALRWFSQSAAAINNNHSGGGEDERCDTVSDLSHCLPRSLICAMETDALASDRAMDRRKELRKRVPFNFQSYQNQSDAVATPMQRTFVFTDA